MSTKPETIYVPLLDEGIEVWRPVLARQVSTKLARQTAAG